MLSLGCIICSKWDGRLRLMPYPSWRSCWSRLMFIDQRQATNTSERKPLSLIIRHSKPRWGLSPASKYQGHNQTLISVSGKKDWTPGMRCSCILEHARWLVLPSTATIRTTKTLTKDSMWCRWCQLVWVMSHEDQSIKILISTNFTVRFHTGYSLQKKSGS